MNELAAITSALRAESLARRLHVVMCSDAVKDASPNANYASDVFLRAAQLQSVGNGFQQDMETKLAELETELVAAIKTGARSTTKLVLQSGTRLIIDAFAGIKHDLTVKMNGLTSAVHERNVKHLSEHHGAEKRGTPDFAGIVSGTPILGATLSEQLDKLASDTIFRFKAAVRTGVAAGDNSEQLAQRITGEGKHFDIAARGWLTAGDVSGHSFHGNQYTEEEAMGRLEKVSDNDFFKPTFSSNKTIAVTQSQRDDWEKKFSNAKVENVKLKDLHPTQDNVGPETVGKFIKNPSLAAQSKTEAFPKVVRTAEGKMIVLDGHHRLTAAQLYGQKIATVQIVDESKKIKATNLALRSAILFAADPTTGIAADAAAEAARKRLLVQVRLMDTTENSINKVIQAAITAFTNATDAESADSVDTDKNMGWQWLAVQDANTCFPAGQKVLTPKGYMGIEILKVGDLVISGKGETRRITNCFARNSNELAKLRLSNGKTIICTPEHLFLSKNKHWIEAQYLRGVELTGQVAGIKGIWCESVSIDQCESRVFDITVEADHTFVVSGVVVHNCAQCEFYDGSQWDSEYEPIDDGPEYPGDPGLHFNCRCSLVPIDLDAKEVPQDMNFDDYLAQFSRSEQEAAFGKQTLRAYQRGDITAAGLMGQKENMMTLEGFKNQ